MFENTLRVVEECDLTFLHIFPYSEREGTPAAKMPQVDPQIRKDRAKKLRELGEKQLTKFNQAQVGRTTTAIIEQNGNGRTEHFAEVSLDHHCPPGQLVRVAIDRFDSMLLKGRVLQ